ncbi:hypothetical protein AAG570_001430 [Ranatra chinensis]|uniref:Protein FAM98A n=1 Tax=Ranatra chinensis TaxID=642074 RepID=A0ABD0YCJ3_9HEMI
MFLEDVLDGLIEINYTKLDKEDLKKAVDGGPRSLEYTQLVEWIANELRYLYKLDEHVGAISTPDDYTTFLLELSSFLKELGCQYSCLTSGTTTERLQKQNDKLLLLDFLIRELQAARILSVQNPDENSLELTINESDTAASLKKMLIALKFPKPPSNISPDMLFSKVIPKAQELATKSVDAPLFNGLLSDKQWNTLEKVNNDLRSEYTVRRKMLLKRLEVTIQSFQWSDRTRGKEDEIVSVYGQKKNALKPDPKVQLSDLLAARQHLAVIEKTSNSNVRKNTQSSVNKIIIGNVPDRGGRPSEQQPPPPEMPSWAPRNAGN